MNILIVDDQSAIVESLKKGIHWEEIGIKEVYTACSAKEAKLILVNSYVDILLTDIEMPEENGLELFGWVKERYPNIIGIFLTSHADFSYAKEAIKLGGFDYILQPARYTDVEHVLREAGKKVKQNDRIHKLEKTTRLIESQRDQILDLILIREREEQSEVADELFLRLKSMFSMEYKACVFRLLWIEVVRFEKRLNSWNENLLKLVFRNVLEELLEQEYARVCVSHAGSQEYCVAVASDENVLSSEKWKQSLQQFVDFINTHMDFSIAVYANFSEIAEVQKCCWLRDVEMWKKANIGKQPGMYMEEQERDGRPELEVNEERILAAIDYIRNNISRNISRTEVAEMLHLNEEYFSRLFHRVTGLTFKDYEMQERIRQAERLLTQSNFSISIIASKVGYDNFSHFSKVFKKVTGYTPQDYRREKGMSQKH